MIITLPLTSLGACMFCDAIHVLFCFPPRPLMQMLHSTCSDECTIGALIVRVSSFPVPRPSDEASSMRCTYSCLACLEVRLSFRYTPIKYARFSLGRHSHFQPSFFASPTPKATLCKHKVAIDQRGPSVKTLSPSDTLCLRFWN